MNNLLYFYIGLMVVSMATVILMIGKERKPITPLQALIVVIVDIPHVWLLLSFLDK